MIKEAVEGILSGASDVIESLPNSEKKQQLKNDLAKSSYDAINSALDTQSKVLIAEMSGNWLQRSWRPILMLGFGFIIISVYFIMPVIDIWVENKELTDFYSNFKDNVGFSAGLFHVLKIWKWFIDYKRNKESYDKNR